MKRRRNLNSFLALLENCRERIAMAGTGGRGSGSGSGGGDNNEERLRKMIVDHLRASELSSIDTRVSILDSHFRSSTPSKADYWGST